LSRLGITPDTHNKKNIIALICIILFSCTNEKISTGVGDFVFSADDKYIYFNFFNGISLSIYRVDSSGNYVKMLIPAINDISFYCPRFFNNNQDFVLIGKEPYSNK
jgi:tetrahydromethanopterin S-methyltransferase subunit E